MTESAALPAHARLSPSSAAGWLVCFGRPNAEAGLPDDTSAWSAEGTAIHEIIAMCLDFGLEPEQFIGAKIDVTGTEVVAGRRRRVVYRVEFDESAARLVRPGIDRVRAYAHMGHLWVETRVDISPWTLPGQFGTCDVAIVRVEKTRKGKWRLKEVIIWDWKWGEGIPVSPVENPQLKLYALGVFQTRIRGTYLEKYITDDTEFRLVINQPRVTGRVAEDDDSEEEAEDEKAAEDFRKHDEWLTTWGDLKVFGEQVRLIAPLTLPEDAPRWPGEKQCQFCKARKTAKGCYALNTLMVNALGMDWRDVMDAIEVGGTPMLPRLDELDPERRAFFLTYERMIRKWLTDMRTAALEAHLRGDKVTGYKAVAGRAGARAWRPEAKEKVEKMLTVRLGDKAYTRKILSPAQVEEAVGKDQYKEFAEYVAETQRKPALVPISHKGAELPTYMDQLDAITDDDLMAELDSE